MMSFCQSLLPSTFSHIVERNSWPCLPEHPSQSDLLQNYKQGQKSICISCCLLNRQKHSCWWQSVLSCTFLRNCCGNHLFLIWADDILHFGVSVSCFPVCCQGKRSPWGTSELMFQTQMTFLHDWDPDQVCCHFSQHAASHLRTNKLNDFLTNCLPCFFLWQLTELLNCQPPIDATTQVSNCLTDLTCCLTVCLSACLTTWLTAINHWAPCSIVQTTDCLLNNCQPAAWSTSWLHNCLTAWKKQMSVLFVVVNGWKWQTIIDDSRLRQFTTSNKFSPFLTSHQIPRPFCNCDQIWLRIIHLFHFEHQSFLSFVWNLPTTQNSQSWCAHAWSVVEASVRWQSDQGFNPNHWSQTEEKLFQSQRCTTKAVQTAAVATS